jgi:hypothetical protein
MAVGNGERRLMRKSNSHFRCTHALSLRSLCAICDVGNSFLIPFLFYFILSFPHRRFKLGVPAPRLSEIDVANVTAASSACPM